MAFEIAHYQRHSEGKDAARQDRQRSGQGNEKDAVSRFCWCQKEGPLLRIALKETDVGHAGPFRSRLASCP